MCVVQNKSFFAARQHADYARQNRRMPLTTSTECQKSRMPSDENIKAADEIFNVKHQLTDNTYKTIMDLLYTTSGCCNFPKLQHVYNKFTTYMHILNKIFKIKNIYNV